MIIEIALGIVLAYIIICMLPLLFFAAGLLLLALVPLGLIAICIVLFSSIPNEAKEAILIAALIVGIITIIVDQYKFRKAVPKSVRRAPPH